MNNDMPPLPPKVVTDRHIPTGIALYGYTDSMVRAYAREYANSQVREVLEAMAELLSLKKGLDAAMAEQKASAILAKHKTTTPQTEG
jgi:hypothetical protein